MDDDESSEGSEESDEEEKDHEYEKLKEEIAELKRVLAKKEYKLKNWGRTPIYSDSESDSD